MRRHTPALLALTAALPCVAPAADTPRAHGLVHTHASSHATLHSVDLADVRWTDGFWADRFATARDVSLPPGVVVGPGTRAAALPAGACRAQCGHAVPARTPMGRALTLDSALRPPGPAE